MKKTETLLGHCMLRASLAHVVGDGRLSAAYAAVRATPKASRVAAFIALWATALVDLDEDELRVTEYARWAAESEATVYRRLREFRELWGEYETPNELAGLLAAEMRRQGQTVASPSMAVAL